MSEAQEITRKAKSNLAFALLSLPKENRDDVTIFYAFCRRIDDIADEPDQAIEEKAAGLDAWQKVLEDDHAVPGSLEAAVLGLRAKHDIPKEHFINLIRGCRMDLEPQRFQTWEDLQTYTHRVASTVGLVCLPLFGAKHPGSPAYAEKLGHALQLTNILRDVSEDLDNEGRVYLPIEDLQRFDYSEEDLFNHVYDDRFKALMQFECARATGLFAEALQLLPHSDRRPLMAAEIMRSLYQRLLEKMEEDQFRVFDRRYKLSKARKLGTLVIHGLRVRF
ncbi:squalene/phytoene synthase family protein [Roseibacillus persicicus]|uniref:phytoene/squalene synthase family protein n=1 Tax=Roseibacillus persicicus TaxID=454148 RepID=UPI00398AFDA5